MKESINGTYCQIIAFHLSFIHLQLQVWDGMSSSLLQFGHVLVTVQMWTCPCHCTDVDISLSLYKCGHVLVTVKMYLDICLSLYKCVHGLVFVQMWTCPGHSPPHTHFCCILFTHSQLLLNPILSISHI